MKNVILTLFVAILLFSCKKDDVKPDPAPYQHKNGTVKFEIYASNSSAAHNFQINSHLMVTGKVNNNFQSSLGKDNSIIMEFNNVPDNVNAGASQVSLSDASLCATPIRIVISFDGIVLQDKTFIDACSQLNNEVGISAHLPGYGK